MRRLPLDQREEGLHARRPTATRRPGRRSNVSCEACHGPGSAHVAWAEAVKAGKAKTDDADKGLAVVAERPRQGDLGIRHEDRHREAQRAPRPRAPRSRPARAATRGARWSPPTTSTASRSCRRTGRRCSREGLYFADGQIQDEVYEYGSFLQSKMYAAGVTCTNCHNPHDLKVPVSADRVCATCHLPEKFDTPGAPLPQGRLDRRELRRLPHADAQLHGRARAPRPQLPRPAAGPVGRDRHAERLHAVPPGQVERVGRRRGAAVVGRQGARRSRTTAQTIHAAREEARRRRGGAPAARRATRPKPGIRRATAASLLARNGGATSTAALARALADPDPLVRDGALTAAEGIDPAQRLPLVSPLLRDPDPDRPHRRRADPRLGAEGAR